MISLELSMVQQNRALSAQLAAATEEFERNGGVIERLELRTFAKPVFNSELIAPSNKLSKAVNIHKSQKAAEYERAIAEKLKAYVMLGVFAASKDFKMSTRRLNFIASNYGIVFQTNSHSSLIAKKRLEEAGLADDIRKEIAAGSSQQQVIRKFGLSRDRLYRMAKTHDIALPGLVDEVEDRKLIERIKAIRDLGIPRTTCAKHMGISQKKLWRIVDMYGVDYPVIER